MHSRGLMTTMLVSWLVNTAVPAAAAPTVYSREGSRIHEVHNRTQAVVLADHQSDDLFYVLPPNKGSTAVVGVTYGANIGYCREMADIQEANRYITERLVRLTDEAEDLYEEVGLLRAEQAGYRREMADLYQKDEVRTAVDLQDAMTSLDISLASLQAQLTSCRQDEDPGQCAARLTGEVKSLMERRREVLAAYVEARLAAAVQYREYLRAERLVGTIDEEIEVLEDDLDRTTERLARMHNTLRSLYDGYGRLEGALVHVAFESGWDDGMAQLRRDNPDFAFRKIATADARVDLSLVPGTGGNVAVPPGRIVLDYTVDGVRYDPADPTNFMGGYPGSHGGTVRTSLIGACVYAHPEYFGLDEESPPGVPAFGLTVRYQYPSMFHGRAWGSYDKWEAYHHLKQVENKGFLWWKESDVVEDIDGDGQGWLEVHIESENDLSDEALWGMRNQIRQELLQQVLLEFGEPRYNPAAPPALNQVTSGVDVVAAGVQSTCGWYSVVCNGVRWVLLGLDAIMPGPDAEARFETRYHYREHFDYTSDVLRWMPATTTFADLVALQDDGPRG